MTAEEIKNRFSYHAPSKGQVNIYESMRNAARNLAEFLNELCPESREKTLAMTKLEEALFWANASIARNPVIGERTT